MKKADAEEAPAMKSMKARSFVRADRLRSSRIVACLLRSLGAASAYQRLRSSYAVAEVDLFSTLHQHQWMHMAQGKPSVSIDAVHVSSLESWEGDEGHESDEGKLQNLALLQCMRLSQTPEKSIDMSADAAEL